MCVCVCVCGLCVRACVCGVRCRCNAGARARTHTHTPLSFYSLIQRTFVQSARQNLTPKKPRRAQRLAHNGHPCHSQFGDKKIWANSNKQTTMTTTTTTTTTTHTHSTQWMCAHMKTHTTQSNHTHNTVLSHIHNTTLKTNMQFSAIYIFLIQVYFLNKSRQCISYVKFK